MKNEKFWMIISSIIIIGTIVAVILLNINFPRKPEVVVCGFGNADPNKCSVIVINYGDGNPIIKEIKFYYWVNDSLIFSVSCMYEMEHNSTIIEMYPVLIPNNGRQIEIMHDMNYHNVTFKVWISCYWTTSMNFDLVETIESKPTLWVYSTWNE